MTDNEDEGSADAVPSGGAKFVLEPKEVVSITVKDKSKSAVPVDIDRTEQ